MKRFKNILVLPAKLASNDDALVRAAELADTNAARLTVSWPVEAANGRDGSNLGQEIAEGARKELEAMVAPYRDRGLLIETSVPVGEPFVEIIRQVLHNGHDLLVKTSRGAGRLRRSLFGSTAMHLLRKCPCAVWLLKPEPERRKGPIVAAIDPDTEDPVRQEMNQKIIELAISLSFLEETPLHVVHAWMVPHEDTVRHSPFLRISKKEAETYVADIEARHRSRLDAFIEPFKARVPGMTVHFVKGLAFDVIPDVARDQDAEVIVLATLARSGMKGMLIGDNAENIINQAECSVLAVKPSAFQSPIAA